MHHPTDRITHTTAFVIPVVEHWLEREISDGIKLVIVPDKESFLLCRPQTSGTRVHHLLTKILNLRFKAIIL